MNISSLWSLLKAINYSLHILLANSLNSKPSGMSYLCEDLYFGMQLWHQFAKYHNHWYTGTTSKIHLELSIATD